MGHMVRGTWRPEDSRASAAAGRRQEAAIRKLRDDARQELAAKIAMAIVDRIVGDIIRPGPKPEERECYVMAEELRAITPEIEALTRQIIDVNDGVQ
jgi:hypothetical protein